MRKYISLLVLLGSFWVFPALFSQEIKSVKTFKNTLVNDSISESEAILNKIHPYSVKVKDLTETILATTEVLLSKKPPQCRLGRLLANFMLEEANDFAKKNNYPPVDIAFLGYGGVRKKLYSGAITVGNIYEVMPFENQLVLVALKGKYLKELCKVYLISEMYHPSAGLDLVIKNGKVIRFTVHNEPIRADKMYYVATGNYWANGGDNMVFFKQGISVNTHKKLRDVFIKHFALLKHIDSTNIPPLRISIQKNNE